MTLTRALVGVLLATVVLLFGQKHGLWVVPEPREPMAPSRAALAFQREQQEAAARAAAEREATAAREGAARAEAAAREQAARAEAIAREQAARAEAVAREQAAREQAQRLAALTRPAETEEVLPEGEGRAEVFGTCTACHSTAIIRRSRFTRQQWDDLMDWMTEKHGMNPLEGEQRTLIVDYLARAFPSSAGGRARRAANPFQTE